MRTGGSASVVTSIHEVMLLASVVIGGSNSISVVPQLSVLVDV